MLNPGTQTIHDRPTSSSPPSPQPLPASTPDRAEELPALSTPLSPEAALAALLDMAKRGELGGFERTNNGFIADVHSEPFDHRLLGVVRASAHERSPHGSTVEFSLSMLKRGPLISLTILVLSLWPGMWLTDTMLSTYFSGYRLTPTQTAMWYVPLTLLPVPWMIRGFLRSRESARREARGLAERITNRLSTPQPPRRG